MLSLIKKKQPTILQALVIEPNLTHQDIFTQILGNSNFQVTFAETGDEVLHLLESRLFNLIIISMQTDDAQASHLCAKLRALPELLMVPIILIGQGQGDLFVQKALTAGATEVFQYNELGAFAIYLENFANNHGDEKAKSGRILYIEGEARVARVTAKLLDKAGYRVKHFNNVEDAYNELIRSEYDLILADMMVKGKMSIHALLRELDKLPERYSSLPVLAMSDNCDMQKKIELYQSGVNDYIEKPVLDTELLARVHNLIVARHLQNQVEYQRTAMRELALRDPQTHLYNRLFLMDYGPKKIREAHRHNVPVSLFVVDLDKFKQVNEKHGHAVGDTVLKVVAQSLSELCRGEDICARFGSEQFVLVLSHCEYMNALNKAEKIRTTIESMNVDGIYITASVGVAVASKVTLNMNFDKMFAVADKAVLRAKETGRNQSEVVEISWKCV